MVKKKFAWRREDILATANASSKNKSDGKATVAPSSDNPAAWSDLRNIADGKKKSVLRPAFTPRA